MHQKYYYLINLVNRTDPQKGADNRIDTLWATLQQTDLSTDKMVFGPIHVFLIINYSNETNL